MRELDPALDLLTGRVGASAVWTWEEAEFRGDTWTSTLTHLALAPSRSVPHPPIYVRWESARSVARVVEYGNGCLHRAGTQGLAEQITHVRDGATDPCGRWTRGGDRSAVDAYASGGVDRVLFYLPTRPRDEALRHLEGRAEVARS